MCLIIHREANRRKPNKAARLPYEVMSHNRWANPDGFGVAWRDKEGLKYEKFGIGHEQYDMFEQLVFELDARGSIEYVAHYRKATQGPPCQALSHPYEYNDPKEGKTLVFHNGIININAATNESDTEVFVRDILANLPSRWWADDGIRNLVEVSIGWSRLLLMTENETVRLEGESSNSWRKENGIWYSTSPLWGSYGTGKGSYTEAYLYADTDDWEESDILKAGERALIPIHTGFVDGGHEVSLIVGTEEKEADDLMTAWAKCNDCGAHGEMWMVGTTPFFGIAHKDITDEAALLA